MWKERDRVIDFELSLIVLFGIERDGFYGEFCKNVKRERSDGLCVEFGGLLWKRENMSMVRSS